MLSMEGRDVMTVAGEDEGFILGNGRRADSEEDLFVEEALECFEQGSRSERVKSGERGVGGGSEEASSLRRELGHEMGLASRVLGRGATEIGEEGNGQATLGGVEGGGRAGEAEMPMEERKGGMGKLPGLGNGEGRVRRRSRSAVGTLAEVNGSQFGSHE
ncbi:MAG: hypothetical protein ACREDE_07160 [Thermoplasmata archaeon]